MCWRFCRRFLATIEFGILVIFGPRVVGESWIGAALSEENADIVLADGGCVDGARLLDLCPLVLRPHLSRVTLRCMRLHGHAEPRRLPVSSLMCELLRGGCLWLAKQIVVQVAAVIEDEALAEGFGSNPVDGAARDEADIIDTVLADHLVLGRGRSSLHEVELFPEQHVRSWVARRNCNRRRVSYKSTVAMTAPRILHRMLTVAQRWFQQCHNLFVCTDGSRVGCRDLMMFVVGGQRPDGQWLFVWGPPQVVLCSVGGSILACPRVSKMKKQQTAQK